MITDERLEELSHDIEAVVLSGQSSWYSEALEIIRELQRLRAAWARAK